ncbi:MAG: hypothetical protein Q7T76_12265 [Ferruginibacter sp.]|nr:hypothetical protein [Ferruginibacter sp.]
MKSLKLIPVLILLLASCKKEKTNPKLSFSDEERKWFIYQNGQSIKFKNSAGDSLVYFVTKVRNEFKAEYQDPFTNPIEIGMTEFYSANLNSSTDSIFIYFYKEIQYNSDPNEMRQTIRWNKALGQFVELEAIKNLIPFTLKTINNVTYNRVTKASPTTQTSYPWTMWETANYDQQFGFIELRDTNGNLWLRQ